MVIVIAGIIGAISDQGISDEIIFEAGTVSSELGITSGTVEGVVLNNIVMAMVCLEASNIRVSGEEIVGNQIVVPVKEKIIEGVAQYLRSGNPLRRPFIRKPGGSRNHRVP